VAQEVLDLGGRVGVDEIPAPDLGLVGTAGVPDGERARLTREGRRVGEDGAGSAEEAPVGPAPILALLLAAPEVPGDDGRVLVRGRDRRVVPS